MRLPRQVQCSNGCSCMWSGWTCCCWVSPDHLSTYYTKLIPGKKGNPKLMWKTLQDVAGIGQGQVKCIFPDDVTVEVANNFNSHFTSISNCLISFFPPSLDFPKKVNEDFRPTLLLVNSGLPINKAIGHDDIHASLCPIFNHASESHCYPNVLNLVRVVPELNQEVHMILVVTDQYPH